MTTTTGPACTIMVAVLSETSPIGDEEGAMPLVMQMDGPSAIPRCAAIPAAR